MTSELGFSFPVEQDESDDDDDDDDAPAKKVKGPKYTAKDLAGLTVRFPSPRASNASPKLDPRACFLVLCISSGKRQRRCPRARVSSSPSRWATASTRWTRASR